MSLWIYRLVTCFLLITSSVHLRSAAADSDEEAKLYIVYLGKNVHDNVEDTHAHHHALLSHVFDRTEDVLNCLVYHYKYGFSGFSAMLTPSQAEIISKLPDVVSASRSRTSQLHTTRSWTYLGLDPEAGVWPEAKFGEDVIVGVFDSGVWPESASFDGTGLSPPPARWKGACVSDIDFDSTLCNNKLIGAKKFFDGYALEYNTADVIQSVRDYDGHGTHTASTAAGARVDNVDFEGLAAGTAVGGAPSAKIAVYKVCWPKACTDADLLAAYDEAIKDGVDIISLSVGSSVPIPLEQDQTVIGSFHATAKGILVSNSAGNEGPGLGSVTSCAPWLLSVAASSLDREYHSNLALGDGTDLEGVTINRFTSFVEEVKEIVDASAIPASGVTAELSRFCVPSSLDIAGATDKVVICQQADGVVQTDGTVAPYGVDQAVVESSGYGVISVKDNFTAPAYQFDAWYNLNVESIPASGVDELQASKIATYISSSVSGPTVTLKQAETVINPAHRPAIAEFSSRGPNLVSPYILKPDITAPGVNILAAYTEAPSLLEKVYKYKMISGTSMSCPHASGAALLIKSLHPTWSPAAIKSALMTTATPLATGSILDYGAGEINIAKAVNPGLIYDLTEADYAEFLCGNKLTAMQYRAITGQEQSACPVPTPSPSNLNYPTITVDADSTITRTVTNVGDAVSTYTFSGISPSGTTVDVTPSELVFKALDEQVTYTLGVKITDPSKLPSYGYITWTDGTHNVTSTIFVSTYTA